MTSPARNRFDNLPHYLLLDILSFLDPKTICSCSQVCKYFHKMVENQVWKPLVLRDFSPFLYTIPLTQQQLRLPAKGADIETIYEEKEEADRIITDPSKEPLTASQKVLLKDNIASIDDWKEFYIRCYKLPKLGGFWVGEYGAHGYELLRIYQKGFNLYAKKLTGDPNIPAGKLTWRMILNEDLTKGKGDVHLADTGFENSRWSTAYIKVVNKNLVEIVWFLQDTIGFWYSLTFGCARAGCGELRDDGEKINLLFLEQLID